MTKTIEEHFKAIKMPGRFEAPDQSYWETEMVEASEVRQKLLMNGWTQLSNKFHASVDMNPEGTYGELVVTNDEVFGHFLYGVWTLNHGYRVEVMPSGIEGDQVSMAISFSSESSGALESFKNHVKTFGWPIADLTDAVSIALREEEAEERKRRNG